MAEKGLAWKTLKNTLGLQTTYSHISHPPQHPTAGCAELSRVVTSLQQHLQISVQSCVAPGKDRVTGQSVGSGASLWHQNAPSINSNHSLASICKLFFFFLTFPCSSFFFPPVLLKNVCMCGERYLTGCWKTEVEISGRKNSWKITFDLLTGAKREKWRDAKWCFGTDREVKIEALGLITWWIIHIWFYLKEENSGTFFKFWIILC